MQSFLTNRMDPSKLRIRVESDIEKLREAAEEVCPDLLVLRAEDIPAGVADDADWREFFDHYPQVLLLCNSCFYSLRRYPAQELGTYMTGSGPEELSGADLLCEPSSYETEDMLTKAVRMIRDNYEDPRFGLDDVTEALFVSRSYLCALFRDELGMSFGEYLRRVRAESAATDIAGSTIQIKEAAARCGILNMSYFSKLFKKYYRMTPMEYRRRWREDPAAEDAVIRPEDIW